MEDVEKCPSRTTIRTGGDEDEGGREASSPTLAPTSGRGAKRRRRLFQISDSTGVGQREEKTEANRPPAGVVRDGGGSSSRSRQAARGGGDGGEGEAVRGGARQISRSPAGAARDGGGSSSRSRTRRQKRKEKRRRKRKRKGGETRRSLCLGPDGWPREAPRLHRERHDGEIIEAYKRASSTPATGGRMDWNKKEICHREARSTPCSAAPDRRQTKQPSTGGA